MRNEHTLRDTSARSSHGSLAHSVRTSSLRALLRFFTLVATLFAQPAVAQDLRGIRRDDVVVRFLPGEAALARAILPQAIQPFPGLPADIHARGSEITVLLAPDEQTFSAWTGGLAPEWGAGVAFPRIERIVLPAYAPRVRSPADLRRTLRHELAHVALQRHLGNVQVPRWFTEGYATWSAGQLDPEADWLLRVAFLTGRAPPLDSLDLLWPAGATDARIAYLLSASAVRYLYSHGGEPAFAQMLERWAAGASLDEAMRASYQFTLARFEQDWSRHVRREYGWLRFLAQGAVVWSITGVIVVAIWMIRHRYNRARLARLRANEIPDDPAFWILQEPADGPEPGAGDGAAHGTDGPDNASPGQVTRRPDAARPGPEPDGRRADE